MQRLLGSAIALLALMSAPLAAQGDGEKLGLGFAPHGGTLGFGVDVAYSLHPRVNARLGLNFMPIKPEFTVADTRWQMQFQSPQFHLALDLFLVSQFRFSGGFRYTSDDIAALGVFTGSVEVGDTTYAGDEVGELRGAISTSSVAPWIGIGWGNVARSRFGILFDVGVAFTGSPDVSLTADGPITTGPFGMQFNNDLQAETQQFEDDVSEVKYYPVIQLGVSFGF